MLIVLKCLLRCKRHPSQHHRECVSVYERVSVRRDAVFRAAEFAIASNKPCATRQQIRKPVAVLCVAVLLSSRAYIVGPEGAGSCGMHACGVFQWILCTTMGWAMRCWKKTRRAGYVWFNGSRFSCVCLGS